MNVLEITNLVKRYGDKLALQDVSFSVREGSCFGLLGPNGAGKSTTMKIIAGILDADGGNVKVFGMDAGKRSMEIRRQVGYVPQEITLYDKLSARENLQFFGEMYGIKGKELKQRMEEVLEEVGLADRAKDPVRSFSGGMKRRINLAAALLHRPKLVILDEPTVGVDPQSRNHIFAMIRRLTKEGVTVIYSTHYMEEVEALCDDIAIIDHGKVIAQGSLQQILDQHARKAIYIEVEGMSQFFPMPGVKKVYPEGPGWVIETDQILDTIQLLTEKLMALGKAVKNLEIIRPSLEQVFLNLTGTSLRD